MKFSDIIKEKSNYTLGFIGGSLTEGFGASETKYRYTSLFTSMMNRRFPDTTFTEINAGIGGTTSALGLFRLKRELLDKGIDMLFIEYAVNDKSFGDASFKYFEGIIRTARRFAPDMPIMCLMADLYSHTEQKPHIAAVQEKIAAEYGIPCVDIGLVLKEKMLDYGGDRTFFTIDDGHPSDYGYKVYVDCMMKAISEADFGYTFPEKAISGTDLANPVMLIAKDIPHTDDWLLSKRTLSGSDLNYITSDKPGAAIEFEFTGTTCGLYCRFEVGTGRADIYLDGKFLHTQSFHDRFCVDFDRNAHVCLFDSIEYKKHTVRIVVSDKAEPTSEGHAVKIAAILYA